MASRAIFPCSHRQMPTHSKLHDPEFHGVQRTVVTLSAKRPKAISTILGGKHASSGVAEGRTPADGSRSGTRRDTAVAVHTERQSVSYRSHLDHRVGGAGAWISGVRYAVRD